MTAPLVSCIVPVYNGETYLGETLESILAQTHRPLDVLVVDDGSTDGSAEVAKGFGKEVRYVYQDNAGPASAYNTALALVEGDFVSFLGADDLWHADKTSRQLHRFQLRPELGYTVTYLENFWIPELKEEAERFRDHRLGRPMPGYTSATLLARKALFDQVGHFDATLQHGHDFDWFLRAAERGTAMEILPDVLMYRRIHHSNRSRRLADNSRKAFLSILKASLDRRRRQGGGEAKAYSFPTTNCAVDANGGPEDE
jgi:glycosyltransferase involved in cell wall biosynthesis